MIPINAKPATGSQPKENGFKPARVAEGITTDAAADPDVIVSVELALPAASKVTDSELSEQVGVPA